MFKQIKIAFLFGGKKRAILLIIFAVFVFSSCSPLKFSSLKYEAGKIDDARSHKEFYGFLLQYYSKDPENFKNPYILTSYPINDENMVMDPEPYYLKIIDETKVTTFRRKKVSGNLFVSRKDIEDVITDFHNKYGGTSFYLLFTPVENQGTNYISYDMTAVGTDKIKSISRTINPCPPEKCFNVKK